MFRHRGDRTTRGVGNFLKAVHGKTLPASAVRSKIAEQPIVSKAKGSAVEAILNVASDVTEGKDVKESVKANAVAAVISEVGKKSKNKKASKKVVKKAKKSNIKNKKQARNKYVSKKSARKSIFD